MTALAQSSELESETIAVILIDGDEEDRQMLVSDLQAEIEKLRKTVTDQEQLINEFLETQDSETAVKDLRTENEILKKDMDEIRTENDNFKEKMESLQQVINEHEALLNDFFDSQAKEETYVPQDPCVICQEEFQAVRTLKCHHSFHSLCISKWLAQTGNCPTCRSDEGSSS